MKRVFTLALLAVSTAALLTGCAPQSPKLTFRLWDPQVAEAYRESFEAFEATTGIPVDIVVVPWADYWSQLRADIAGGIVDDVFWTNATNLVEYAEAGALKPVPTELVTAESVNWSPAVVAQYTVDGQLWGVPQLTDPGIGILYNTDLLTAARLSPADVAALHWDPAAPDDSLRATARRLTVDAEGRHPGDDGFDSTRVTQYGYSAANDLNAILLPFLGSNSASWQTGDEFDFASPDGIEAIEYVANLINQDHVAPTAADTNPPAGGDFSRDQFLQGRLALFQTGAYNLANIVDGANFQWGIAPLPTGPAGAISVTNGIAAVASARTDQPDAQRQLLEWLGSAPGSESIGASGAALPAVISAQESYLAYWEDKGIDISPMLDVLANGTIQAPQGAHYPTAANAMQPILNDIFLGRRNVAQALHEAQEAANDALR